MDKVDCFIREYLAETSDFLGAIRLPSDAFKDQGTKVVTDIVFLKRRDPGASPNHSIQTGSLLARFPLMARMQR